MRSQSIPNETHTHTHTHKGDGVAWRLIFTSQPITTFKSTHVDDLATKLKSLILKLSVCGMDINRALLIAHILQQLIMTHLVYLACLFHWLPRCLRECISELVYATPNTPTPTPSLPSRIGCSSLFLSWGVHVNHCEVLHNLLHLLRLEESRKTALT